LAKEESYPPAGAEPGALQRIGEAPRVKPESLNETQTERQQSAETSPWHAGH
jgi:hypothetical protein